LQIDKIALYLVTFGLVSVVVVYSFNEKTVVKPQLGYLMRINVKIKEVINENKTSKSKMLSESNN